MSSDHPQSARLDLFGGMRAGWINASIPCISISMTASGARLSPRWRVLKLVVPAIDFKWAEVDRVVSIRGVTGAQMGLRFVLARPPEIVGGFLVPWRSLIRRPIVWFWPGGIDRALALVPATIPRTSKRGLLFWPER
jgi:hypothetical protein